MRTERNITKQIHYIMYQLKGLRFLFFVPFVLIYVVIPLICVPKYFSVGIGEELYRTILEFTQMLIPVMSVWWLIFVFREYIESEGNEILFLYSKRIKLSDATILFFFYVVTILPFYILSCFLFQNFIFELIKMVMICVFYFGLSYLLIFLSSSTAITWMTIFLYTVANSVFYKDQAIFPLYYSLDAVSIYSCLEFYLPLMLLGLLFLFLGVYVNKRWRNYT